MSTQANGWPLDHRVATYLAEVAYALETVGALQTPYGEFSIMEARLCYDGDPTDYYVMVDEHGGWSIAYLGTQVGS